MMNSLEGYMLGFRQFVEARYLLSGFTDLAKLQQDFVTCIALVLKQLSIGGKLSIKEVIGSIAIQFLPSSIKVEGNEVVIEWFLEIPDTSEKFRLDAKIKLTHQVIKDDNFMTSHGGSSIYEKNNGVIEVYLKVCDPKIDENRSFYDIKVGSLVRILISSGIGKTLTHEISHLLRDHEQSLKGSDVVMPKYQVDAEEDGSFFKLWSRDPSEVDAEVQSLIFGWNNLSPEDQEFYKQSGLETFLRGILSPSSIMLKKSQDSIPFRKAIMKRLAQEGIVFQSFRKQKLTRLEASELDQIQARLGKDISRFLTNLILGKSRPTFGSSTDIEQINDSTYEFTGVEEINQRKINIIGLLVFSDSPTKDPIGDIKISVPPFSNGIQTITWLVPSMDISRNLEVYKRDLDRLQIAIK